MQLSGMDKQPIDSALLRLVAIVESADAAIYSVDLDGRVTSWNRSAEQIFGYTSAEIVGRSVDIIDHGETPNEYSEAIARIRDGHTVEHYETRRRRRDGSVIDVALTVSPIRGEAGEIVGISTIARDITRQRLLEQRSRHLASIVDSSDDAIVSKDPDGIVLSWNRSAERMFGYSAEEAIGKSIRLIVPDDRQSEEDEVLRKMRRGEAIDHFETVRQHKDGTPVRISLTVSPIRDEQGRIVGASKIARDITERERAAERAAFLAQTGKVVGGSLDYEATLTAVANLAVPAIADWCAVDIIGENGAIERLAVAHVDPTKTELARTIRDRYEDPRSPYSIQHVIRTGEPAMISQITDDMIVAAAKGDQERIEMVRSLGLVSYVCVPLVAHGRTLGALTFASAESGRRYDEDDRAFAQEVADRAALAVDNARAYKEAQVASRLKDEFLATLSHELRTPLNAILGYARLLNSGMMAADKQPNALATVERNATALAQMVEDVLDVSRIISGKIRLNIQPVDVPSVVRNAVNTIMPAADAKQIRIQTIVDPVAAPVAGDPDRLQQVAWNLVSNAVKFTPKHGQVQVRVERINSSVEIVVSDTGIGLKPEFVPHLFERFRQGDGGITRENPGLGLGLAIARHLVELHGGSVYATSAGEGQGATFRVRLPVMIAHAQNVMQPSAGYASPAIHESDRLEGIHVLVLDDDRDALSLVRDILERVGARITTIDSPGRALDQIAAAPPDVILADVGLPEMDGFRFIQEVRKRADARLIPAAALTAYARPSDRVRALESGFQMHLAKPVDPVELVAAIAALLNRTARE
jgi:PAS domain S-box-containing protein